MSKVKIGIIGAGNIAQSAHIPAYLKRDDVELTAVCDINEERAKEVAARYGIPRYTTKIEEITAMDNIDGVSVCTNNNAHCAAAVAAARAKMHILCEKPMAMTVEEAEKMTKEAKDNGIIFMMGFVNRFRADTKLLKEFAEKGKFGDIYYSRAVVLRRRGTPLGWFTDLKKSGGGPVIDIGVHVIDLAWYLMGKPKPISVTGTTYSKIGDYKTKGVSRWVAFDTDDLVFETEDSAAGFIRFEDNKTMSFDVSWAINAKSVGSHAQIFGSKAGAKTSPLEIYSEEEDYLMDSTPIIREENPFENEINHFIQCVKEKTQPLSPPSDGYYIQKILNGIYESARLGREVIL